MGFFTLALGLAAGAQTPAPPASTQALHEDCSAWLAETPDAWRALPPQTLDALGARLEGGSPALYLWQGTLVCDHIEATLCTEAQGRGRCVELRLGDPERGCEPPSDGPFCLQPKAEGESASMLALVRERLDGWSSDEVWRSVEREGVKGADAAQARGPRVAPALWPMALGVLSLFGLIGLGILWGRLAWLSLSARAFVPPLVALLVGHLWPELSTWDLIFAGLVLGGAGWTRGRYGPIAPPTWGRFILTLLFALALGEGAARLVLPPPDPLPPPQAARLLFEPEARERSCQAIYPGLYPDAKPPSRAKQGIVLHLGDSMVEGQEVAPSERFTAILSEEDEATQHLNAGFAGTGPDHHLRVLRAWWPLLEPEVVVLYLYPGNDLLDLDRDYACCGHGPLLDGGLESRCEAPQWAFPLQALLARSPPPYLLRALSGHSRFAAHLTGGFSRLALVLEPRLGEAAGGVEPEEAWARYRDVMVAIKRFVSDRGATLHIVLLPTRAALEPEGEASRTLEVGDRIAEVLRLAQIPAWDARPMFRTLGRQGSFAHLFSDLGPYNEHLGKEGHRALANWLLGRLARD